MGLRWRSEIKEDGTEEWVYESCDEEKQKQIGKTDSFVFWTALYAAPIVWGFFAFIEILSLKLFWMNLCIICMILTGINTVGFYKCQRDHENKIKNYI